jgi:serine O-acetyltransferase
MITNKRELREYLKADSRNYKSQLRGLRTIKNHLLCDPISDQRYIWKYIVALRHVEYYTNVGGVINKPMKLYWLRKLRKLSYKTDFQIPPNTCGKGLTIWHWGSIIINPATRIGENCTLYPGILMGHKSPEDGKAPVVGNNVFIGTGTKIIGGVHIGDNVTIGQNCVITHDVPDNSTIVINNKEYRLLS